MKQLDFSKCFAAGAYCAPTVELCEVVAERGFQASLPGTTINPWESDNDASIQF